MFEKEIILEERLAHGASSSVARPEKCRPIQTDKHTIASNVTLHVSWFGVHCESEWKTGSSQKIVPDGNIADTGKIVEDDPQSGWSFADDTRKIRNSRPQAIRPVRWKSNAAELLSRAPSTHHRARAFAVHYRIAPLSLDCPNAPGLQPAGPAH